MFVTIYGMTNAILNWSGILVSADNELTDTEINERYGTLIRSAVSAFRSDPSYMVEIAEAASKVRGR